LFIFYPPLFRVQKYWLSVCNCHVNEGGQFPESRNELKVHHDDPTGTVNASRGVVGQWVWCDISGGSAGSTTFHSTQNARRRRERERRSPRPRPSPPCLWSALRRQIAGSSLGARDAANKASVGVPDVPSVLHPNGGRRWAGYSSCHVHCWIHGSAQCACDPLMARIRAVDAWDVWRRRQEQFVAQLRQGRFEAAADVDELENRIWQVSSSEAWLIAKSLVPHENIPPARLLRQLYVGLGGLNTPQPALKCQTTRRAAARPYEIKLTAAAKLEGSSVFGRT